jgi:putative ABC transport system permease protein
VTNLRQVLRSLAWNPGFTLAAVVTLALGIGVSTAMFSFVDAVLVKPAGGIVDADRLVLAGEEAPGSADPVGIFSPAVTPPVFFGWRDGQRVFSQLGASTLYPGDIFFSGRDRSETLRSLGASAGFFEALGIQPLAGRVFNMEEERSSAGRVTVLTHRFWQSRFGGDPGVLGAAIRLNGEAHTVVGILPPNQLMDTGRADLWLPLAMDAEDIHPRNFFLVVHARLKPGITLADAENDLNRVERALKAQGQAADSSIVRVRPYRDHVVGRDMRRATLLLSVAVALILFIACTNLAHLLVARYARTRKDIAVRVALGASRGQVIRQFLTESLVLCLAGGISGLILAFWLLRGLAMLMPPSMFAYDIRVAIDLRVLLFTIVLSTLTGAMFGLLPGLTFARRDIRASGLNLWGSTSGASRPVARHALLVGVVALTFTLVSGSVLLLGSLGRLFAIDPGFRSGEAIAMQVRLDRTRYASISSALAYQELMLDRIRQLPGVASAAVSNMLPLTGRNSSSAIAIAGLPASRTGAGQRFVSPDYFTTMQIPLVRGRLLSAGDTATAPRVAVINETYARVLKQYRDPLGAELLFQRNPVTVVGIVGDVKHRDLTSTSLNEIFVPLSQTPEGSSFLVNLAFVVRTTGKPAAVSSALNRLTATGDKDVAVASIRTMDEHLLASIAQPRFVGALFGLLAGLALALTTVGIYGVLSAYVSQRRQELGIRLALGAQRRDLLRLVMMRGLVVTSLGLALGSLGAVLLGRALSSMLFEVSASDPVLYAGSAGALAAVALLACWLPAWRAANADPLVVLRAER